MAQVNFIEEMKAFHRFANANMVTANERLLWQALFFILNDLASGKEWPDDMVSISNKQLLGHLPYGEDSLIRARKNLAKRRLIQYKPGKKNTLCPHFKLMYFAATEESYPQNVDKVPIFAGNMGDNTIGYPRRNGQGNTTGNLRVIPINLNNTIRRYTQTISFDNAWRTSASARSAVAQRILDQWGGDKRGGFDSHRCIVEYLEKGMTPEQIVDTLKNCGEARFLPFHLHTEALPLGVDQECDAPVGY